MDSLLQTASAQPVAQYPQYQAVAQIPVAQAQAMVGQQLQEPAPMAAPMAAPAAAPMAAPMAAPAAAAPAGPATGPQCAPPAVQCINAACMGDLGCSEVQNGQEVCGCVAPPPPPPPPAIVMGSPQWQEMPENKMEAPGPAAEAGMNLAAYEAGPISVQLASYLKNKAAKAAVQAEMGQIILKELKDAQPCELVTAEGARSHPRLPHPRLPRQRAPFQPPL